MPMWSIRVSTGSLPTHAARRGRIEPDGVPLGIVANVAAAPFWRPLMTGTSVIVAGARTPVGRLLGSLKDFSAADLGAHAIKAALARAGVSGDQVQYVILGQVLQAGAGQIPSRQAAVKAGIPMSV